MIKIFSLIAIQSLAQNQFFTTSDSVNLYINIRGNGTSWLYIHGVSGTGSHWREKFSGDLLEERFSNP